MLLVCCGLGEIPLVGVYVASAATQFVMPTFVPDMGVVSGPGGSNGSDECSQRQLEQPGSTGWKSPSAIK